MYKTSTYDEFLIIRTGFHRSVRVRIESTVYQTSSQHQPRSFDERMLRWCVRMVRYLLATALVLQRALCSVCLVGVCGWQKRSILLFPWRGWISVLYNQASAAISKQAACWVALLAARCLCAAIAWQQVLRCCQLHFHTATWPGFATACIWQEAMVSILHVCDTVGTFLLAAQLSFDNWTFIFCRAPHLDLCNGFRSTSIRMHACS